MCPKAGKSYHTCIAAYIPQRLDAEPLFWVLSL